MRIISAREFGVPLLAWARNQFAQEVRSDFQRIRRYDGLMAKEHLAALQKQTPQQLEVLSSVLPLGVFWETPVGREKLSELSCEERSAVEKLRADFKIECDQNWDHTLEILRRARLPEIKAQFKLAVKEGNILHAKIGKQRNWHLARAAPGEWGFIAKREWGRVTVSVNLSKFMALIYTVSVSNSAGEHVRSLDHYLMALGIGGGDWDVGSNDGFAEKFLKASEFGFWHAAEYEAILNRL